MNTGLTNKIAMVAGASRGLGFAVARALAKEGVKEFMFVLGQARVKGTVQMIINPVAMW